MFLRVLLKEGSHFQLPFEKLLDSRISQKTTWIFASKP